MSPTHLQALHDIQQGKPIGIWPLAYGWYLLIIGISCSVVALSLLARHAYKARKPKQLALKRLKALEALYLKDPNPSDMAYQLTVLLKRVCFAYYPREKIASLYGKEWQHFIGDHEWGKTLQQLSYQKNTQADLSAVFPAIKRWIKTCNKRGRNV